jgi:multidrug resistance efflux pump
MTLRAPGDGTVVQNTATEGAYVVTGTQLAVLYDLADVYITARVDETDLPDVRIGGQVDITVDCHQDQSLIGVVHEIHGGTTANLSGGPPDNTAAVFDRPTQVVPVRIAVNDPGSVTLLPGMNVSVKVTRA